MSEGHGQRGGAFGAGVRLATLVALLLFGVYWLYQFASPSPELDPTAMLALGFVILAGYCIGELAGTVKLPHVTGYILSGLAFGPSLSHYLPEQLRVPPFDRGILSEAVVAQLAPFDLLAVALIAITAGGELKIDAVRKSLRVIGSILVTQVVIVVVIVSAFILTIVLTDLRLPGLPPIELGPAIALSVAISAIALGTSPAATIAVINGSRARGPVTRLLLSTVVVQDVVVVVFFAIALAIARPMLGGGATEGGLLGYLFKHIGVSLAVGTGLGFLISLYLRFVKREILLFLVGMVFGATWASRTLDLDPILVFLGAGFTVSNFSREGDALIHSVEKLSLPVYVVFFTLAGAKLHADHVIALAPYAFSFIGVRALALTLGTKVGMRLGNADAASRKYGWMGFISQAGVALSLSQSAGRTLGPYGPSFETLLVAGVALNELAGPVLCNLGLSLAGEIPKEGESPEAAEARRAAGSSDRPGSVPPRIDGDEPYGGPLALASTRLNAEIGKLEAEVRTLVREAAIGVLERFREQGRAFLRELRRELLLEHRRLAVRLTSHENHDARSGELHATRAELAARFRTTARGRAKNVEHERFDLVRFVEEVDRAVAALPERVIAPIDESTFVGPGREGGFQRAHRLVLRARRGIASLGGGKLSRRVDLRALGRYHLSYRLPGTLEHMASELVELNEILARRTVASFEDASAHYTRIARTAAGAGGEVTVQMAEARRAIEGVHRAALEEMESAVAGAIERVHELVGFEVRALKRDVTRYGTLDLPVGSRRASKVFKEREEGLSRLRTRLDRAQSASAAEYARVALELELVELEATVDVALEAFVSKLERDVRGRTTVQLERVLESIDVAIAALREATGRAKRPQELAEDVRKAAVSLQHLIGDAAGAVRELRDSLADEGSLVPLVEALDRTARGLTETYELPGAATDDRFVQDTIPFRELVASRFERDVAPKLVDLAADTAMHVQPVAETLDDLERLVGFHVGVASGELEISDEEVVTARTRELVDELVVRVLERHREFVSDRLASSLGQGEQIGRRIRETVLDELVALRKELVGETGAPRESLQARAGVADSLRARIEALPRQLSRSKGELARAARDILGEERLDALQRSLGLPRDAASDVDLSRAFASAKHEGRLPALYQRLFAFDAVDAADVVAEPEKELSRARAALLGGTPGLLRTYAIVGADGVGKAALSSAIVRSRPWKNVRRVVLQSPVAASEVTAHFQGNREGSLIVLDGFHFLVGDGPAGADALRRFVDLILDDAGRAAWLVHADALVFRHACALASLDDVFAARSELAPLGLEDLERVLRRRHALSGYAAAFARQSGSDASERVRAFLGRVGAAPGSAYAAYFTSLHAGSYGLVREAFRLWLASIERVDSAGNIVHVGRVPPSPLPAMRKLPDDVLVALLVVARQGWTDARTFARAFALEPREASARLARLARLGMFTRDGDVLRVATHLHASLLRCLEERGWLS